MQSGWPWRRGILGAGIGGLSGVIGQRVGNSVATGMSGIIYRNLVSRSVATETAWNSRTLRRHGYWRIRWRSERWYFWKYYRDTHSRCRVWKTCNEWSGMDATWHGLAIDGPLSVVGATTERFLLTSFISRTSWKCPRSRR